MSGIKLIGVGMTGLYQFGCVTFQTADMAENYFYPMCFLGMLDDAGDILPAFDMPVEVRPGFLIQGDRDAYGDTSVLHGKAKGHILPSNVKTTLGCAMPTLNNTAGTGFYIANHPSYPDNSKIKIFSNFSDSYTTVAWRKYHKDKFTGAVVDGATYTCQDGTVVTWLLRRTAYGWYMKWVYDNSTYLTTLTIRVTGNLFHLKRSAYDNMPDLSTGSYYRTIYTKSTGKTSVSSSSTNTGLIFQAWTKRTTLANIPNLLVLEDGEEGHGSINRDLLSLRELSSGNALWQSCFNAVESLKYFHFEWIEFFSDLTKVKDLLTPLKNARSKHRLKLLAELFLWWTYGVKPTASDLQKLFQVLGPGGVDLGTLAKAYAKVRVKYGTAYAPSVTFRGKIVTTKCNSRVRLQPRIQPDCMLNSFVLCLAALDINVDAQSLWESIPYSFVVDWFVNTSDFMRWIDTKYYPNKYHLLQSVVSTKRTVELDPATYFSSSYGLVTLELYERAYSTTFPNPPFEFRFKLPTSHLLEGSALLITKLS